MVVLSRRRLWLGVCMLAGEGGSSVEYSEGAVQERQRAGRLKDNAPPGSEERVEGSEDQRRVEAGVEIERRSSRKATKHPARFTQRLPSRKEQPSCRQALAGLHGKSSRSETTQAHQRLQGIPQAIPCKKSSRLRTYTSQGGRRAEGRGNKDRGAGTGKERKRDDSTSNVAAPIARSAAVLLEEPDRGRADSPQKARWTGKTKDELLVFS